MLMEQESYRYFLIAENKFKMEVTNKVGVDLKRDYNGVKTTGW